MNFSYNHRRREREKKRLESGKTKTSKDSKKKKPKTKKAVSKNKELAEKKKEMPDTSKDEELAQELSFGRAAKTPSGVETKRQAAIAQYSKDRAASKNNGDESDDLDYGEDDDSDDDDDEYADESKPWMNKKKPTTRRSALDRYSEEDDDDDDDRGRSQRTFVEADLEDFKKVTIPRRRLARWCNEPYFEEAVINFYVRLAIGRDNKTQKPCYRLCKIIGVEKAKKYEFPSYNNQEKVSLLCIHSLIA